MQGETEYQKTRKSGILKFQSMQGDFIGGDEPPKCLFTS